MTDRTTAPTTTDESTGIRTGETSRELYAALAAAQGAIGGNPGTNKVATVKGKAKGSGKHYEYTYRYLDLPALLAHVRPAFAACGLAIIQPVWTQDGRHYVATRVVHRSGEWLEIGPVLVGGAAMGPQDLGGAITYQRRYQLQVVAGVAGEEDDDAQQAQRAAGEQQAPRRRQSQQQEPGPNALTPEQRAAAREELQELAGRDEKGTDDLRRLTWLRCLVMAEGLVPKARHLLRQATRSDDFDGWQSVEDIPEEPRKGSKVSALQVAYGKVKAAFEETQGDE